MCKAAEGSRETGADEGPSDCVEQRQASGRGGDAKFHWVEKQMGGEKIIDFPLEVEMRKRGRGTGQYR